MSGTDHATETLTAEFDGSQIEVEVVAPEGWTPESVTPTGCNWESEEGQHVASFYWDDVQGGTTLSVDGTIVEEDLSKREASTRLAEWSLHTANDHSGGDE